MQREDVRWNDRARAAALRFGDVAVATRVEESGEAIVVAAVHHENPERRGLSQRVIGERYRRGQGLPGRVWETERGILIVDVDDPALEAIALPGSRAYIQEIGLRSVMLVPLWDSGRVVGTLGVARDAGRPPYTQEDYDQLTALAVLPSRLV